MVVLKLFLVLLGQEPSQKTLMDVGLLVFSLKLGHASR